MSVGEIKKALRQAVDDGLIDKDVVDAAIANYDGKSESKGVSFEDSNMLKTVYPSNDRKSGLEDLLDQYVDGHSRW